MSLDKTGLFDTIIDAVKEMNKMENISKAEKLTNLWKK